MQRAKAWLVAGGCSASTPLQQLPLTARPGHLSALSSPKHQRPALHAPAGLPSHPWRCRFSGPIPSRQPPDLPAQPPAIRISHWAERNPAKCHSFSLLLLSNSLGPSQTAKRSSASSCSAFFLILAASGFPACLRYNPLGDLRREEASRQDAWRRLVDPCSLYMPLFCSFAASTRSSRPRPSSCRRSCEA